MMTEVDLSEPAAAEPSSVIITEERDIPTETQTNAITERISAAAATSVSIPEHEQLVHLPEPEFSILDLSYNDIKGGLDAFWDDLCRAEHLILDGNDLEALELPMLPKLKTLSLNRNKINDYWSLLEMLGYATPNLTHLSLILNPGWPHPINESSPSEVKAARNEAAHHLPKLRFLDSIIVERSNTAAGSAATGTATSSDLRDPVCLYQRQRTAYSGMESEGNRFISDKQL